MHISALVNSASRSVPQDGEAQLSKALQKTRATVHFYPASGERIEKSAKLAIKSKPDLILVWGGDGTCRTVLTRAGTKSAPVLILPGGTMNLLHKQVHGDRTDWQDILEKALAAPQPEIIPAGKANRELFYVAMLAGRLTGLAESREAVRKGELVGAVTTLVASETLDITPDLKVRAIGLRNKSDTGTAMGIGLSTARNTELEVASISPDSHVDLIKTGVEALRKGWREAEKVSVWRARKIELTHTRGETIPVTLDGEQTELPAKCTVSIVAEAAKVLKAGA